MTHLDVLNQKVTLAIRAMQLAAMEVCNLETRIAALTEPNSAEGRIARRGAISAAVIAGDDQVRELLARFALEEGIEPSFVDELRELIP